MEKSKLSELRIKVRLTEENHEIAILEKCFGFVEIDGKEDAELTTKTIDETISDFEEEIERKAMELNRTVPRNMLDRAMFLVTLLVVNQSQPEVTLNIPVEKRKAEEEKDDDSNSHT